MSAVVPPNQKMIQGVGVFRHFRLKPPKEADNIAKTKVVPMIVNAIQAAAAQEEPPSYAPKRATIVYTTTGRHHQEIALVEEWENEAKYLKHEQASEEDKDQRLGQQLADYLLEPPTSEYFPDALHIYQGIEKNNNKEATDNIGILVRQNTQSHVNGMKLRDSQREAYERQMKYEPGCTCCIILSNSKKCESQVRIIELWKTMDDFEFHESSEWHALGETKVVPLVTDMDCDFCYGQRIQLT